MHRDPIEGATRTQGVDFLPCLLTSSPPPRTSGLGPLGQGWGQAGSTDHLGEMQQVSASPEGGLRPCRKTARPQQVDFRSCACGVLAEADPGLLLRGRSLCRTMPSKPRDARQPWIPSAKASARARGCRAVPRAGPPSPASPACRLISPISLHIHNFISINSPSWNITMD